MLSVIVQVNWAFQSPEPEDIDTVYVVPDDVHDVILNIADKVLAQHTPYDPV